MFENRVFRANAALVFPSRQNKCHLVSKYKKKKKKTELYDGPGNRGY